MLERICAGMTVHMNQYSPVLSDIFYKTDNTDTCIKHYKGEGKEIPLQAPFSPEGG